LPDHLAHLPPAETLPWITTRFCGSYARPHLMRHPGLSNSQGTRISKTAYVTAQGARQATTVIVQITATFQSFTDCRDQFPALTGGWATTVTRLWRSLLRLQQSVSTLFLDMLHLPCTG
ncbi:hypothetical protein BaRGS_00040136, partial [Batillaria attramentaria]